MSPLVVLLAHGSPDPRSSAAVEDVAARLETFLDGPSVRAAYLDHNWPTLTAAIGRERDAGSLQEVVVLPLLLSNASHALRDSPAAVTTAERDSRLAITVGETVGLDLSLALALDAQIPDAAPVVAAWASGRSQQAQDAMRDLVAAWKQATGREVVAAAASESGESLKAAALELQAQSGVAPAFATFTLFPGVLADQVSTAAQSLGLTSTTPLFAELALIEILALRLSQTTRA